MDKSKVLEFFDGSKISEPIHIIGCGAIGSHVAELLTRIGCDNIHLWDMDTVSAHNITNQMFFESAVGRTKLEATAALMHMINHDMSILRHDNGWNGEALNGYVFLCVDNIDLRRQIIEANKMNKYCKAFFDFRMRLTDAQHYAAVNDIFDNKEVASLLKTMDFSHDEVKDATPKSACNVELSVAYAPKAIVCMGVANFVNMIQGNAYKKMILLDMKEFNLTAF